MKKIIVAVVLASFAGFTSCSKDDDKDESEKIKGTWYLYSESVNGEASELDDCKKKTNVEFDGRRFYTKNYEMNEENQCVESSSFTGEYTYKNGVLKVIDDAPKEVEPVENITEMYGDRLVFKRKEVEETKDGKKEIFLVWVFKRR